MDIITSEPSLKAVNGYHFSENVEAWINALLDANHEDTITLDESNELDECLRLEHIMRKAKIRAFQKLDQN